MTSSTKLPKGTDGSMMLIQGFAGAPGETHLHVQPQKLLDANPFFDLYSFECSKKHWGRWLTFWKWNSLNSFLLYMQLKLKSLGSPLLYFVLHNEPVSVWDRFGLKAKLVHALAVITHPENGLALSSYVAENHWSLRDRRSGAFSPFCAIIAPVYLNLFISVVDCRWWNRRIPCNWVLRNVLKLSDSLLTQFTKGSQSGEPRPVFAREPFVPHHQCFKQVFLERSATFPVLPSQPVWNVLPESKLRISIMTLIVLFHSVPQHWGTHYWLAKAQHATHLR